MTAESAIVDVQSISKAFKDRRKVVQAVNNLSFTIKRGEVFGLLGPNGAGKTTTLRIITGLLNPDSGKVQFFQDAQPISRKQFTLNLGVIPQELVMYHDLTVGENLRFIADMYDLPKQKAVERITKLVQAMGLEEKLDSLVRTLSGGQKRRLNIILGLVHDPEVVLCDEPTPGLDPQSRVVVWDFLKSLPTQGKTVILTTHFMEEADRLCDRVAIVDHGQILVLDNPAQLKQSIGQGDLLEVTLMDETLVPQVVELLENQAKPNTIRANVVGSKIQVQSLKIVQHLQHLLASLEGLGTDIAQVNLRPATLEDVFIHLTGRGLRS